MRVMIVAAVIADSHRCHLVTVDEALRAAHIMVKEKGALCDLNFRKFLLGVHRVRPFKTKLFLVLTVSWLMMNSWVTGSDRRLSITGLYKRRSADFAPLGRLIELSQTPR
jgi:hypothetical protein